MERGGERLRRIQAAEVARRQAVETEDIRVDDDDDDSSYEEIPIEDHVEDWDDFVAAIVQAGLSFEVDHDNRAPVEAAALSRARPAAAAVPPVAAVAHRRAPVEAAAAALIDSDHEHDNAQSEDDDVMDDGVTDNDDDVEMQVDDAAERSAAMAPGVTQVDRDSVVAMEVENQDEYQIAALRHAPIAAVAVAHRRAPVEAAAAALIDSDHEDDAVVVAEQPDEAPDLYTIAQEITNTSSSITTHLQDLFTRMQNDPQFIANEDFGVGNVGIDTTRVPPPQPTFDILAHPDGRLKVELFKKEDGTTNVVKLKLAHIDVNNNSNLHPNQKALLDKAYTKHEQLCQQAIDQSTWTKTKKDSYRRSGLYERHHIIPTSCGGSNHDYNLVYILIIDHIKIHGYLSVMFSDPGLHSIFCFMASTSRCRGLISMQRLQAALTQDDLLQSLVCARAENRRYKLSIHKKVKNGDALDDEEKKVINSSHTLFLVIYFVPLNILHLLYSFLFICMFQLCNSVLCWLGKRNPQKSKVA